MVRSSYFVAAALAAIVAPGDTAAAQEVDPIEQLVEELEGDRGGSRHPGIEAMLIEVGGARRASYLGNMPAGGLDLRSATKSITALVVGIAIDQGAFALSSRVVELLPEYAGELGDDPRKQAMTVEDLLTMRSGLDCNDWDPKSPGHEDTMYRKRDWIRFWASRPMRQAPGAGFSYCTGNVVALGRIVANRVGKPFDRFAEEVLFSPVGIRGASWERWNRGKDIDTGGHLRLHPNQLVKIGALVLNKGRIGERRVVSSDWIERMTSEITAIPDRPQRYGYLWWLDATTRPELPKTRLVLAWGNGGTYLIVLPELDAVVVFVGTRYNRPEAIEPLRWLGNRILPALGPPRP